MRLRAIAALLACVAIGVAANADDTRRSGYDYMTPALQAMQRDDTQNPALLWVRDGEARWSRPAANGRSCAGCHDASSPSMSTAAARYPAFDAALGRPLTLAGRIDRCRQQHLGQEAQGSDGDDVLALSAWLAHRARGTPVARIDDARLEPWRERGERVWTQRIGQLDLACSQCHDRRAGQRLGGATINQAHPTGYPTYRLEWQSLGSLQRRLRGCVVGVRAEPFAPDAGEWLALETYLMQRAAGMALEGPAVRP